MYFFTTYLCLVIGVKSIQGGNDEVYDFSIRDMYYDEVTPLFVSETTDVYGASGADVEVAEQNNKSLSRKSEPSDFFKLALKNYKSAVCYRSKMEKLIQERNRLQEELRVLQEDCS